MIIISNSPSLKKQLSVALAIWPYSDGAEGKPKALQITCNLGGGTME